MNNIIDKNQLKQLEIEKNEFDKWEEKFKKRTMVILSSRSMPRTMCEKD